MKLTEYLKLKRLTRPPAASGIEPRNRKERRQSKRNSRGGGKRG